MADMMQRCVPVSTGALGPDLRVNYQFGLVLGVDEFEQEDLYFRERDERAARTLHGYGTASGLHVTAARPGAAPSDVEVRVEPGIAVDQYGRPVVIPTAQCARIGSWIAAEESAATDAQQASPLGTHLRPSGDLTLYVVVEYSSCPDALVPLPGNPCGTDDDLAAPSRIRDSWHLGLRWTPPPMPHWDGLRALADLLLPIELHDGPLMNSDEHLLAAYVRALATGASPPTVVLPLVPVLPRIGARAALDRLLTIWITEVRPSLSPDLLAPADEAVVLLTSLTVVPISPFDNGSPAITAFTPPDDEGRPYLAPTQLIQELVQMGGGAATILAGSPIEPVASPSFIELASLEELSDDGARQLVLWTHLSLPLVLPDTVDVRRDGGDPVAFSTGGGPRLGTTLLISPDGAPLVDGELLDVELDLTLLRVRDDSVGTEWDLMSWLRLRGQDLLDREGTKLVLHHVVASSPTQPLPAALVRQLVTATGTKGDNRLGVELWWHVDKIAGVDEERITDLPVEAVRVLAEVEGAPTPVDLKFDVSPMQHNVFRLIFDFDVWVKSGSRSPYIRVVIDLAAVRLLNFGASVVDYSTALGVAFTDVQEEGRSLVLWVRLPVAEL